MYIYESHLGGYYSTDERLDYECLYCDTCGDSDIFVGEYDEYDKKDVLRFVSDLGADYSGNYLLECANKLFNMKITKEDVCKTVKDILWFDE